MAYWDEVKRAEFPAIATVVQHTLCVPLATGIQESSFSSADHSLSTRKTMGAKQPGKLEAKVLMKQRMFYNERAVKTRALLSTYKTMEADRLKESTE